VIKQRFLDLLRPSWPPQVAARVTVEKQEVGHLFGMAHRKRDRDRRGARMAHEREPFQVRRGADRLQVADLSLEGNLRDLAIREAVSARVVAHIGAVARQLLDPMPPHRILAHVSEVAPERSIDERGPRAFADERQLHAVEAGAEADLPGIGRGHAAQEAVAPVP
jgi:hypothetical protein